MHLCRLLLLISQNSHCVVILIIDISAKNALLLLFADSVLSYSVKLTFSNVSLDSWRLQSKNLVMQETIANLTSDFCRTNSEKCGVSSGPK